MSNLYSIIVSLLAEKNISSYRMCKDIGMQPSVISDLKMGRKQSLHPDSLQKIADYFGVTVDYLLGNEKSTPAETGESAELTEDQKRLQALAEKIGKLSPKKLAVLESLLDAMENE